MLNGTLAKATGTGAEQGRWRQWLAATLLLMAGLVFASVAWTLNINLPNWMWLALVAVASLALAAPATDDTKAAAAVMPAGPEVARDTGGDATAQPQAQVILTTAGHEFRTPLNAIIGFAGLLADGEASEPTRDERIEYANAIRDNAQQLQQRINDVLDANRIAGNAMTLSEQPCDIAEIIEAVCREQQVHATAKGVTIVARIAGGISCTGDLRRLHQAIACVVNNAIAFSPGDGIINVNMLRGTGGGLVVSITDAGPGLSAAEAALAFEPFRQVEEGMNRPHNGMGLGLYLARGIMRLHGGDVKLASLAGAGTEARLFLPAGRVNWATEQPPHHFAHVRNVA
ncbi:MAG: HAMP domain-containing histidine kinase [Rhizobiales bacterium]|nr:HAMP domain-containing histidine kinase [Hyphomicrobiales bacterium]